MWEHLVAFQKIPSAVLLIPSHLGSSRIVHLCVFMYGIDADLQVQLISEHRTSSFAPLPQRIMYFHRCQVFYDIT